MDVIGFVWHFYDHNKTCVVSGYNATRDQCDPLLRKVWELRESDLPFEGWVATLTAEHKPMGDETRESVRGSTMFTYETGDRDFFCGH